MHGLPSSAAAYQQKSHLQLQQANITIVAAATQSGKLTWLKLFIW